MFKRSTSVIRLVVNSGSHSSVASVANRGAPIQIMRAQSVNSVQHRNFTSSNQVQSEADFVCLTDISKPSEKVERLSDEVLALDFLEYNQLMRYMQVN